MPGKLRKKNAKKSYWRAPFGKRSDAGPSRQDTGQDNQQDEMKGRMRNPIQKDNHAQQSQLQGRDQPSHGMQDRNEIEDRGQSIEKDNHTSQINEAWSLVRSESVNQMETHTSDPIQTGRGTEVQSQTSDHTRNGASGKVHNLTINQAQDQKSVEVPNETNNQLASQNRSQECDRIEAKNYLPSEEHEFPRDESLAVEGASEAGGLGSVTPAPTCPGKMMSLFSGTKQRSVESQSGKSESLGLVGVEDLNESDIIIAVVGPTGSGKSTFVHSVSEHETTGVGSGLKSFTSEVRAVRFREQKSGRFVVLVDTPGFDDTFKSDLDILDLISDWLSSSYKKGKLLSGILYLHRITDNRVAGTSLKNLRVFRKLCGDDALEKVYFTTTMWDEVAEEVGKRRLEELKSEYWKNMINHGARIFSCGADGSPKDLVQKIIEEEDVRQVRLQQEIVELQKEIKETEAGQELYSHLEAIVQKQTEVIGRLHEAKVKAKDPQLVSELQNQLAELRRQMDEKLLDMEKLKLPWMKRFFSRLRDPSKLFRSLLQPF